MCMSSDKWEILAVLKEKLEEAVKWHNIKQEFKSSSMNRTLRYIYLFTFFLQCGGWRPAPHIRYRSASPLNNIPRMRLLTLNIHLIFNYACVSVCGFVCTRPGS